jgi:thioredoxin reductase (NADPH)
MEQTDALIVGSGPAGCSAALYLCRAGFQVTLIGSRAGALERAERIENYYGLTQPLSGRDLAQTGRLQALALGAQLLEDEVLSVDWNDDFAAQLSSGRTLAAPTVLLATGKARSTPAIPGLKALEGRGVSYCAVCDAFLYRGRTVAVLGGGDYARHEMEELLPLAGQVVLLTNGAEQKFTPPEQVAVHTAKLTRLRGELALQGAALEDGTELELDGCFVALGNASAGDLARRLGARLDGDNIAVNPRQETNVPGLYAAGDCTGSFAQIAFAVAEGAKAALAMIPFLRQ